MHSLPTSRLYSLLDGQVTPMGKEAARVTHSGSKSRPTLHLRAPAQNLSRRMRIRPRVGKQAPTGTLRTSAGIQQDARTEALGQLR
jgi:hypothetical protein